MPRTLSVTVALPGTPPDLDGSIVVGLESLRQRIEQAIKFRLGSWFIDQRSGVPYTSLLGHQTTLGLAASTITQAIIDEGGSEVLGVHEVEAVLDHETRQMSYSARVETIYDEDIQLVNLLPTAAAAASDMGGVAPPSGPYDILRWGNDRLLWGADQLAWNI